MGGGNPFLICLPIDTARFQVFMWHEPRSFSYKGVVRGGGSADNTTVAPLIVGACYA
jgi:hypothetical protein